MDPTNWKIVLKLDQLIPQFHFTFFVGRLGGQFFIKFFFDFSTKYGWYNFEENKFFVKAFDRKVDLSKHETDDHLLPRKVRMNINKNIVIFDIQMLRV